MKRNTKGFTLIELMIVVAIIAIIASIAIPNLLSARVNANEVAAISSLKNLSASQGQLQAGGAIDNNNNGSGEYGYFKELAGGGIRTLTGTVSAIRVFPPVMSRSFGNLDVNGTVVRSGYHFRIFLPNAAGTGVAETQAAYNAAVDTLRSESMWCCYAWPTNYNNSGKRAFFITVSGDVLTCRNTTSQYSGSTSVPAWDAAFLSGVTTMNGTVAAGGTGNSGETWVLIN